MSVAGKLPTERPHGHGRGGDMLASLPKRLPLIGLIFCGLAALPLLLLLRGSLTVAVSVPVVFFVVAVFYHRVSSARILDEARSLRDDNAVLLAKLSEEKLAAEKARDAAEVSARAKSVFIANISHEIRTPLNALLGMSQLLERAGLEKPHRDYVRVMLEAGRGLRTLLDDVITLARDDSERHETEECDAGLAARAVAQLLQPRAWEKQVRLNISAPSDLPRVAADPRRVRQVLLKLAENALKFTERGAVEILVEAIQDGDGRTHLRFAVNDTGHGIPEEVAKHLFEPFMPGDTSYTRKHQGAGLGLAVAKRVIEQLGGTIGFESEPGSGSTFWFTLPSVAARNLSKQPFVDISGDMPAPADLLLLVYLRNPRAREEIAKLLEPFGNHIVVAHDAADAAHKASRDQFDAIIAEARDVEMLAAVPGRKAPLLALMFPGERPPASGDQALHWPARPREFYGVLHGLSEEAQKSQIIEKPKSETPPIDANAFAALEKSLGLPTLLEILQSYVKTAEELCEALSKASAESDWQAAARVAQDIAGAAGGLGLAAMTAAARNFAAKTRETDDGHALRNDAQLVVGEHLRVCVALSHLYPDLAA
ncbi:MAG TPA: ATP-binding protein [Rhizomicrobium sp.]|jgi:signal transduction histidine kinase/HPt (histidine-containing phosphotransfer) domain-containing protein|nr:ATP-binding protein [Rhizomicrobium sp.]